MRYNSSSWQQLEENGFRNNIHGLGSVNHSEYPASELLGCAKGGQEKVKMKMMVVNMMKLST